MTQPNKSLRGDFDYKLRILETELASSYMHGTVTDLRSVMVCPGAPDGCWVYVYDGGTATIVPDDICLDPDATIIRLADRPLL